MTVPTGLSLFTVTTFTLSFSEFRRFSASASVFPTTSGTMSVISGFSQSGPPLTVTSTYISPGYPEIVSPTATDCARTLPAGASFFMYLTLPIFAPSICRTDVACSSVLPVRRGTFIVVSVGL